MSRTARWSAVSANTMPVLPGSFPADPIAPQCPTWRLAAIGSRPRPAGPALIFRHGRGKHGADRSRRPRTIDATSLFCFQRAALCLQADCVERKEEIMVRFVRLLAAAAFAAALASASAASAQGVPLQEGPLETGPLQTGPSQTTSAQGEAAPDGAQEAGEASRAGRAADHGACPALVPDGGHAGSRGLGRQRLCLRHFQPGDADRGDLFGHAWPGAAYRPVRQCRARADAVQVLSWRPGRRSRRGNSASTATSNPGGSSRTTPLGEDPRLDRVALRRACGESTTRRSGSRMR